MAIETTIHCAYYKLQAIFWYEQGLTEKQLAAIYDQLTILAHEINMRPERP